jgi:hypothetical protein
MNPFDFVKSITQTKEHLIEQDPANEKGYVPFLTNKSLSYHYDCLSFAQEMNTRYHLDARMQYDYLYHTVRAKRRTFQKWAKPEVHATLAIIQQVFGYSRPRAEEAMKILSPDQLLQLMKMMDPGGLTKTPKR